MGQGGDAGQRGVDAFIEGLFFFRGGHAGAVAMIRNVKGAGERRAGAAILRFLIAEAFAA